MEILLWMSIDSFTTPVRFLVCHNPQCHPAAFNRKKKVKDKKEMDHQERRRKKKKKKKKEKKRKDRARLGGDYLVIIDDLHYHFLGHADEAEDWQAPASAPHLLSAHHLHYHGSCLCPRPIPWGSEMAEASG